MERNDLLTRYDRKYLNENGRNYKVDHRFDNGDSVTEPVTLALAKEWCHVTDTANDNTLNLLITAAREAVEEYTKLSLIPRKVTLVFNNPCGGFELMYGPIISALSAIVFTDKDGVTIDNANVTLRGLDYLKVEFPRDVYIQAVYNAGFTTPPKDLMTAMLDQIDFMYGNRGADFDTSAICKKAIASCQRWARTPVIS
jgi:uncharacterized phiE125 gp8 family phage protein